MPLYALGKAHFERGSLTHFTVIGTDNAEHPCRAVPTLRERLSHAFSRTDYETEQITSIEPDLELETQIIAVALQCPSCIHAVIEENSIYCKLSGTQLQIAE